MTTACEQEHDLRGRTVLVTGGAKGLGRAFCRRLGRAGANVVISGRDQAALDQTGDALRAEGISVQTVVADVTDLKAMRRAVASAVDAFGGLDVLVNNAGTPGPIGPAWEVDADGWWQTVEVNLRGTMLSSTAALEVMAARRHGRIINVVSHAGAHRWPFFSAYAVSKGAVIKLTDNLAAELRQHNVAVLSFHPGLLDLGMTKAGDEADNSGNPWAQRVVDWVQGQRAEGRFAEVERATGMLLHLAAGGADERSGGYLTVDDELCVLAQ
jgi:NAD(P)-dependent dehydrogenase (short-subunit alcohol dehydrogenase family)